MANVSRDQRGRGVLKMTKFWKIRQLETWTCFWMILTNLNGESFGGHSRSHYRDIEGNSGKPFCELLEAE